MFEMAIGDYLPYRFLWPSDEEWLQAVLAAERYELLNKDIEGFFENKMNKKEEEK
jgi:hypothetical protein